MNPPLVVGEVLNIVFVKLINWWGRMMTYLWMSCSEVYMTRVHPNNPN